MTDPTEALKGLDMKTEKTWWLLEHISGQGWLEDAEHETFTSDPNKALRWPNETRANDFRAKLHQALWLKIKNGATEHKWIEPASPNADLVEALKAVREWDSLYDALPHELAMQIRAILSALPSPAGRDGSSSAESAMQGTAALHSETQHSAGDAEKEGLMDELRHAREASVILKGDPEAVETYRTLRAERDAALSPAGSAWRPIESAPRDGTPILGAWRTGAAQDGTYAIDVCCWAGQWMPYARPLTHWQPLPSPPPQKEPGE